MLAADKGDIDDDEHVDEPGNDDGEVGTDKEIGCLSRSNLACFKLVLSYSTFTELLF